MRDELIDVMNRHEVPISQQALVLSVLDGHYVEKMDVIETMWNNCGENLAIDVSSGWPYKQAKLWQGTYKRQGYLPKADTVRKALDQIHMLDTEHKTLELLPVNEKFRQLKK